MIFVSSACVKNKYIGESVKQLAEAGYKNIELSGGTQLYDTLEPDLMRLKETYSLNYLCHNYFPPPSIPFVINLASLDEEISLLTIKNIEEAIRLTKVFGSDKFGFHAGFLLNIPVSQIGKSIVEQPLFDEVEAKKVFFERVNQLKSKFPEVRLYIENNVISAQNYSNFKNNNPLFLCDFMDYTEMSKQLNFNLLLDVAHLKVSSETLGLDFSKELDSMISNSNYIHISDNDGKSDSNKPFSENSEMFNLLKKHTFENKIITVEVYGNPDEVKQSYLTAEKLING